MQVFDVLSSMQVQGLIQSYGLWVLFALVMCESMGLPLPGETALIAAAVYAGSSHRFGVPSVILTAASAAILGDNLGYLIGRTIGLPILVRYGKYLRLTRERLKIGQYLFMRHGGKIVFFGRFAPFLRVFAAVLAGANHMHWSRFLVMNALGGITWATLFGGGAYVFGENLNRVAGPLSLMAAVSGIAVVAIGMIYFRRHEKQIEERAKAALAQFGEL